MQNELPGFESQITEDQGKELHLLQMPVQDYLRLVAYCDGHYEPETVQQVMADWFNLKVLLWQYTTNENAILAKAFLYLLDRQLVSYSNDFIQREF